MKIKLPSFNISITPVVVLVIGFAAYLGFYPLFQMFQSGAIRELLAAIFGAMVVTFITLLQLRQQTVVNETREKQTQIFKEKLTIFREYLDLVRDVVLKSRFLKENYDEAAKGTDTIKIIFLLSRLRLHCETEVVTKIGHNLFKLIEKNTTSSVIKGEEKSADSFMIDHLFQTCELFRAELSGQDSKHLHVKEYAEMNDIHQIMQGMRDALLFGALEDEVAVSGVAESLQPTQLVPRAFYTNLGGRSWQDMQMYSFWQAGGTERIVNGMHRLKIGDSVCAYASGYGYVGIGVVDGPPEKVEGFHVQTNDGKRLLSDVGDEITRSRLPGGDIYNNLEYAVPVKWDVSTLRTKENAIKKSGLFAAPMTSCLLTDKTTLDFLSAEFGYKFNS